MATRPKLSEAKRLGLLKLQSSGLSEKDAKTLGIEYLSNAETKALGGRDFASIKIPYGGGFYRLRYLDGTGQYGSSPHKDFRYYQPKGITTPPYFPASIDWEAIEADITRTIVVTEGELKAACPSSHGIATLALGGCGNFRSQGKGITFLPQLEPYFKPNRPVTICFDADAAKNKDVASSVVILTSELVKRSCLVSIATLPPDGPKGIDDYIVANGFDAFKAIIDAAKPDAMTIELWRMNAEFAYLKICMVVELEGLKSMSKETFITNEGNRVVTVGTKQVEIVRKWLGWPLRNTYDAPTYAPGQPATVNGQLNMWPGYSVEPVEGDITPWTKLLDHLFQADPIARKYAEQWLGYPFVNPIKMMVAMLIWSETHGIGKSLISQTLSRIYGRNYRAIKQNELDGDFTGWIANKQYIALEEMTGHETRHKADILKGLITEEHTTVNEKYQPSYVVPACANFCMTSNSPKALFLEHTGERRYFVYNADVEKLPTEFYDSYVVWMNGNGPSALLYHFRNTLDLSDFRPHSAPPVTAAMEDMVDANRGELDYWLAHGLPNTIGIPDLMTPSMIADLFNSQCKGAKVAANALGRRLRQHGIRMATSGPLKIEGISYRYCIVRNVEKWTKATRAEITKHLETEHKAINALNGGRNGTTRY